MVRADIELIERLLVACTEPVDINWAIKANDCINGAAWADGRLRVAFAIAPIGNVAWWELAEAVETRSNLTGKQRLPIECAITGANHNS